MNAAALRDRLAGRLSSLRSSSSPAVSAEDGSVPSPRPLGEAQAVKAAESQPEVPVRVPPAIAYEYARARTLEPGWESPKRVGLAQEGSGPLAPPSRQPRGSR